MKRIKLNEVLNKKDINQKELYYKLTILNISQNNFNYHDYNEFLYSCMYVYHKLFGIESLSEKCPLPYVINRQVTYNDFVKLIEGYKEYPVRVSLLPSIKNHYDNITRLAVTKIVNMGTFNWTKVYSDMILKNESKTDGCIYLSVDNQCLHKFADILFNKCLQNKLFDFNFKINNTEEITKTDNVVIYFNRDNLNSYLPLIKQILNENPDIKLNESYALGYNIDNNISIGKDTKDNSDYTNNLIAAICSLKKEGLSNDAIADYIENLINHYMADIAVLVDEKEMTKKR